MKFINKVFGFSTKNLYLAELVLQMPGEKHIYGVVYGIPRSFYHSKYVLVRKNKKKYSVYYKYKDVFTGSTYLAFGDDIMNGWRKITAYDPVPIVSNKRRIRYKDAEKILKEKNSVYIKN